MPELFTKQHSFQGCGVPMPDLSGFGLFVGGQVNFTRGIVCGQVNLRQMQHHNFIIFNFASMPRNTISTRYKASRKRHSSLTQV